MMEQKEQDQERDIEQDDFEYEVECQCEACMAEHAGREPLNETRMDAEA